MRWHRTRRATQYSTATPVRPSGCDGAGPSAGLRLPDDAKASTSSPTPCGRARDTRNAAPPITRTGS
jgi:hypothetical protein